MQLQGQSSAGGAGGAPINDAADGVGEEELLWGTQICDDGHLPGATPIDRLDPSVPHSAEFDYSFQEMMQADADKEDDEEGEWASHDTNIGACGSCL